MFSSPPTSVNVLPYSCVTEMTWPASKPEGARHEVRQAHRHLGEAAQQGQRVVEAEVHLQPGVHGHAQQEERPDRAQEDESLAGAAQVEVAGAGDQPRQQTGGNGGGRLARNDRPLVSGPTAVLHADSQARESRDRTMCARRPFSIDARAAVLKMGCR